MHYNSLYDAEMVSENMIEDVVGHGQVKTCMT